METDPDANELPQLLHGALIPMLRLIRSARSLSAGKVGILRVLADEGRASAARMSQAIGVSQQAISLSTKELENLGLIQRERDDADRRKLWFLLTEAGQQKLDGEIQLGYTALEQAMDSTLDAEDLKLINAAIPALKKIRMGGTR